MRTKNGSLIIPTRWNFCEIYLLLLGMYYFLSPLFRESTLSSYLPQILYTAFWYGTCLFLLIKMFLRDIRRPAELCKILAILLLLTVSYSYSQSSFLTPFLWFLAAGKSIDVKKALRSAFIGQLLSAILIVSLATLNLIPNITVFRTGTSVVRYSMGFTHPNSFAQRIFILSMVWLYLLGEKLKVTHLVIVLGIGFGTYLLSDSNTAFLLTFAAVVLQFLYLVVQQRIGWTSYLTSLSLRLLQFMLVIMVAASAGFSMVDINVLRQNQTLIQYSTLLSRLTQITAYASYYSIKPFGQPLYFVGSALESYTGLGINLYTLDNGYAYLLIGLGWVMFALFLLVYVLRQRRAILEKDYPVVILLSLLALYGFSETCLIRFSMNTTLLFLMDVFWSKPPKTKDRKKKKDPLQGDPLNGLTLSS